MWDKSQDIVANIKQGKAPWQGNPNLPKYTGRSIRIEKIIEIQYKLILR